MAHHTEAPLSYKYIVGVRGCHQEESCILAGTDSCPMLQTTEVISPLVPRRKSIPLLAIKDNARIFREAVKSIGLTRRDIYGATINTLAQDMILGVANRQYKCEKIGGMKGHVVVYRSQVEEMSQ